MLHLQSGLYYSRAKRISYVSEPFVSPCKQNPRSQISQIFLNGQCRPFFDRAMAHGPKPESCKHHISPAVAVMRGVIVDDHVREASCRASPSRRRLTRDTQSEPLTAATFAEHSTSGAAACQPVNVTTHLPTRELGVPRCTSSGAIYQVATSSVRDPWALPRRTLLQLP